MSSREDRLLRRLLKQIVWPEKKLDRMIELLEQIKGLLTVAPPPAPPPGAVTIVNLDELRDMIVEALEKYESLRFANDLHVEVIDLGIARTGKDIAEFPKLAGIALTIFRNTGTFDLYLNEKDDYHKITFDALTYPQTFLIDWLKIKTVFIGNSAQSGKSATLIAWKRKT